jgi:hypothetical protein
VFIKLEDKVNHLTELLSALTPAVDSLVANQGISDNVNKLVHSQEKSNLAVGELRLSNMRLASAIEKLIVKIDKVDEFDERLRKIEAKLQ